MRLSLIQMSSGAKKSADNVAKACDFIDQAAKERPDLIVTPEYFNTGYFPMYRDARNYDRAERAKVQLLSPGRSRGPVSRRFGCRRNRQTRRQGQRFRNAGFPFRARDR